MGRSIQVKVDMALEMNAAAEIGAGREPNRAAARFGARLDGMVDGRRVEGLSVAGRAMAPDIEFVGCRIALRVPDEHPEQRPVQDAA